MTKTVTKLNPQWVTHTRMDLLAFLQATNFPHPVRNGQRGSTFDYPEWLILLIAVLAVKCKVKTYLGIHRLVVTYWPQLTPDAALKPISESQLRERLKKSAIHLEHLQQLFFNSVLRSRAVQHAKYFNVASADKMMVKATGPVWHQKQKQQGLVPPRLRGLDRDATWSFSQADGRIYGHGTFCLTAHPHRAQPGHAGQPAVLGRFVWMPNSAHEAKRLLHELPPYAGQLEKVCMDSKADDCGLYEQLQQQYGIQLLTAPRHGTNKTPERQHMIRQMRGRYNHMLYRQRATTVEPMQALVKTIFDLDDCWMRGDASNRWLFAAMGVAVQVAQRLAYREKRSTWRIKEAVLGL